ncbi:MAG: metal ABC transporter permease [Candidatus Latescibacterota bacterium]|nr:MAG: metal ABC transporter permease [Candidatus Latescibacterota bacterium]
MTGSLGFFVVQMTLIAVVLVLHTYMGLHIIRRTIIFCDLVLAQQAALGALVGIALGVRYATGGSYGVSLITVLIGSVFLTVIKPRNRLIPREAVIGIMFALALVASLLLGDKISGRGAYVTKTLAGSMLWVNWKLVWITVVVYLLLIAFHFWFRDRFIGLSENPDAVKNQRLWDFLFFATQGIITVMVVPIAGVLLAYSFLMIPAAIAGLFSKGWIRAVIIGWTVGLVACLVGLVASYHWNLPYGPSLVLSLGLFFLVAVVLRSVRTRAA